MNKEEKIEEMAMTISAKKSNLCEVVCGKCKPLYKEGCYDYNLAKYLVNAGYGNVKQAVKEFAEKLKAELWKLDGSWQYIDGEELCETVDNLITELYGADK